MNNSAQNFLRSDLFLDRILLPAYIFKVLASVLIQDRGSVSSIFSALLSLLLPILVLILLVLARPTSHYRVDCRTILGLMLSFFGFWLFKWSGPVTSFLILGLGITNLFFYTGFAASSYVALGRSFGVVPAARGLICRGPYRILRHPIYSSFLHIALSFLVLSPTYRNFLSAAAIVAGLFLRANVEEDLLLKFENYDVYKKLVKSRFFCFWVTAPLIILSVVVAIGKCANLYAVRSESVSAPERLVIQVAYPVTSLDPTIYDDWSSVFVGNHIYPRLFFEGNRPDIPAITDDVFIGCAESRLQKNLELCKNFEIRFKVNSFQTCQGKVFDVHVAKREFEYILKKKTWILPGWRSCKSDIPSELCYVVPRISDAKRRLRNLYFRFGWSLFQSSDKDIGAGPYCLRNIEKDKMGIIQKGILVPLIENSTKRLPLISVIASEDKNAHFNIALYGTKELATGLRLNLQTYTPLAYYVITNEVWSKYRVPWNTIETRRVIAEHMIKFDMLYPNVTKVQEMFPPGSAIDVANNKPHYRGKETLEFAIPDYLPNCHELADKLSKAWKEQKENVSANCVNTSLIIESFTRHGIMKWFGIMSPLSPGAPSRDSIRYQYFSSESNESLTGKATNTEALYYMVGIGQSLATVDQEKICGLQANSMGLGDLFITDFIQCDH